MITDILTYNAFLLVWSLAMFLLTTKSRPAKWYRFAWLAGPLVALTPFLVPNGAVEVVLPTIELPVLELSGEATVSSSMSWWAILYVVGIVSAPAILIVRIIRLVMIHRRSTRDNNVYLLAAQDVDRGAFSFFKKIYLPSTLGPDLRSCVIKHEQVHVQREHSLDVVFVEVLKILFWFNPAVYLMKAGLSICHEYEADELTSEAVGDEQYVNALLSSSFGLNHIASIVHPFSKANIKTRITMLHSSKKLRLAWILPMVAFAMILSLQACTKKADTAADEKIYETVDKMAEFQGGMEGLITYVSNNLEYPQEAKDGNIQGMVAVSFVVGADGKVKDATVLKSLSEACDAAALSVFNDMPDWTPAEVNGETVAQSLTLPIRFQIDA
ncbi:M56 family metallopeptidase [Sanyastnella coralliicola]|uniref:M56 family metallopeptidase n=1 Tax=Sanyastnella coralliicola TaxID=3069118 RepID=UPI0027BAEF90|nr:M56 family metallopeptidase [Longitalea sp. SCSIO 12813]